MAEHITNEELIRLVQEKPAEELTPEEIDLLRERMRNSAELHDVVIGQLQLESCLNEALGTIEISIDAILSGAAESEPTEAVRTFNWWGWPTALLVMLAFVIGVVSLLPDDGRPKPDAGPMADGDHNPDDGKSDSATGQSPAEAAKSNDGLPNTLNADAAPPPVGVAGAGTESSERSPQQRDIAAARPEPWAEALDPARPPRPFQNVCFTSPADETGDQLPAADLQRWFDPVQGQPHRIRNSDAGNRTYSQFEGVARLRAPWPKDAFLRLTPYDIQNLRIDVWNGATGVSLHYFAQRSPQAWAAFAVERKQNEPHGEPLALLSTDNALYQRSGFGTFELRHQNGSLLLTRGSMLLLSVPLAEPPAEMYFAGTLKLRSLSMGRSTPFAEPAERDVKLVTRPDHPALWDWFVDLPSGAELVRSGEGSVELSVAESTKGDTPSVVWAGTPLARRGLYEVIVRIEDPEPGTGIFLGDAEGTPVHHVGFFRDKRTGRTTFGYGWTTQGYLKPGDVVRVTGERDFDPKAGPVPFTAAQQWLRIVVGFGGLRLWTSGDGRHWGQVGQSPVKNLSTEFATVGLYAVPHPNPLPKEEGVKTPRKIRLRQLEVRELTGLTALASDDVRRQVPYFPRPGKLDFGEWLERTIAAKPHNVEMDEWRRACAIEVLAHGTSPELAKTLLNGLIADGIQFDQQRQPGIDLDDREIADRLDACLRLLDDAALLSDLWETKAAAAFAQHYAHLGRQLAAAGEPQPYSRIVPALMASPIWSEGKFETTPEPLVRHQLLQAVYSADWSNTRAVYQEVRFWNDNGHPGRQWWEGFQQLYRLLEWSIAQADASQPAGGGRGALLPVAWRHPLVSELSKEGYNVMAEFEAAIAGKAYQDACQIISAAGTGGMLGLLPDAADPNMLVSLPAAVALAMDEHPQLRLTMNQQFGPVGLLRVRQAMADGDVESVESASVRFYGTEAASEAHRWLGDRSLAAGRFGEAIDNYRNALKSATASSRAEVVARLRLCAAMLGYDEEEPVATTISLPGSGRGIGSGDYIFNARQFESLVAALRQSHGTAAADGGTIQRPTAVASGIVPPPTAFQVQTRAQFSGNMGQGAGEGATAGIDWAARQLGIAVDETQIYVSNRFQVVAYDVSTGQQKWATALGGDEGRAHHLPSLPMQPLVAGDRVFIRRLTKQGAELACLEKGTGKLFWKNRPDNHVASDPVYVLGKLLALIATFPRDGILQLDVARFHPETGDVLSQRPFIQLRDLWSRQPRCQVVAVEGQLLCMIGGTIACADASGRSRWVRRQTWIPDSQDLLQAEQHCDPPVVDGRHIFVTQAGVRGVGCIDAVSGREIWTAAVPGIKRCLGVVDNRLVVETRDALQALDRQTGEIVWTHPAANLLHGYLCGGEGKLVYSRFVQINDKTRLPCLVWIDPATGREVAHEMLRPLADADPQFGRLIAAGQRLWAFYGRSVKSPQRELVELTPATDRSPVPTADARLARWIPSSQTRLETDVETALPGWTLVTPNATDNDRLHSDLQGRKDVLATQVGGGKAVRFVREFHVPRIEPGNGNAPAAALLLQVGHQPKAGWSLRVQINGKTAAEQVIDDASAADGWKDLRLDLAEYAGQTVWVTVCQQSVDPKQATTALWQGLKFVAQ